MGFSVFKKKSSQKVEPMQVEGELNIPPPPPPPSAVIPEDLPSFSVGQSVNPVAPPILKGEPILPETKEVNINSVDLSGFQEKAPKIEPFTPPKEVQVIKSVKAIKPIELPNHNKDFTEVKEDLHRTQIELGKPFFVNMDYYKQILDNINYINGRLKALENTTIKLDNLRQKEDAAFRNWHSSFEAMRKKLLFVDEILFEKR